MAQSEATRSIKATSNEYYTEGFIVKSKDFERIADTNKNKSPLARIILGIKVSYKNSNKSTKEVIEDVFFTNCILKKKSVKAIFYTILRTSEENRANNGRH